MKYEITDYFSQLQSYSQKKDSFICMNQWWQLQGKGANTSGQFFQSVCPSFACWQVDVGSEKKKGSHGQKNKPGNKRLKQVKPASLLYAAQSTRFCKWALWFSMKGGGGQQRILQSYFKVYTFSENVHAYYTLGMDKRSSSFFVMYL